MTSNAVQRPQTSGTLRVAAAWARLRCSASSTMSRHRLDRRTLHPGPRRSQRDPRDFYHGLMGGDEIIHSILDVMYARAPYTVIERAMHIHPTVSELIPTMLGDLKPLE